MMKKLTPKQKAFIQEYLVDLNATKAALRAGYSKKSAGQIGSANLAKPYIKKALEKAMKKRSDRTKRTQDQVVEELAKIAFGDISQIVEWDDEGLKVIPSSKLSQDKKASIAEISERVTQAGGTIKIKQFDKLRALEMLGRHLGAFTDKVQVSGRVDLSALNKARERVKNFEGKGEGEN